MPNRLTPTISRQTQPRGGFTYTPPMAAPVQPAIAMPVTRPAFYVTQELFQREGLPGLLPRKRGPKRPHKLSDEAMAGLAQEIQEAGRMLKGEELAALLVRRFGVEAHPRSILRRLLPYLRREEKKLR